MKISLTSAPMTGDIDSNIKTIEEYLKKSEDLDLLVFGESFLQGFESLTWDYEKDLDIALDINDEKILYLRSLSKKYETGLSFGFIEKDSGNLYSSNLLVNKDGQVEDIYRRVSKGWTIKNVSHQYKIGEDFSIFEFMGKKFLTAICGDLWYEKNLKKINDLNPDYILWPLYIDYSLEEWEEGAKDEYLDQVSKLKAPVLMVSSYMEDERGALGGAYFFKDGKIFKALDLGRKGQLVVEL